MTIRNPVLSTINHYRRAGSGKDRNLCACGRPFTRQHLSEVLAARRRALAGKAKS